MDAVVEGGTAHVASGVYEEEVEVEKPLTLIGEDREPTVIEPEGGGTGVEIGGEGVAVSNFTVRDYGYGIRVGGAARVRVQNCRVLNSSKYAIELE
ncbi:MAG: hypothetical protein DRK00_01960 [Thermoprotei archaeon]|nr:MAG: hypothetical protein DRK00_01960 [Thermoprotei archaeon]